MYLAAEGGQFNGCDVAPQGMEFVKQIYFRAWRTYFDRSQNFDTAYDKFLQPCNDLYDPTSCAEFAKALQAVESDQLGICDDPLGAAGESAPPCAVSHGGTVVTTRSDGTPATTFEVGEELWLSLTDATPDRDLDFLFLDTEPERPIWRKIGEFALDQTTGTVLPDGTLFTAFFTPTELGIFDIVVDGNQDGIYQPWADVTLMLEVTTPSTVEPGPGIPGGRLLQVVGPNPFHLRTDFSLQLSEATRVRLVLYDATGRVVRELIPEGDLAAGQHVISWDGRDETGSPLRSGVYNYRLEGESEVEVGKVTMLR